MKRRNMQNTMLDDIGGEPLVGSGFENEEPEPDFDRSDEEAEG
jgi:hypothetical protein